MGYFQIMKPGRDARGADAVLSGSSFVPGIVPWMSHALVLAQWGRGTSAPLQHSRTPTLHLCRGARGWAVSRTTPSNLQPSRITGQCYNPSSQPVRRAAEGDPGSPHSVPGPLPPDTFFDVGGPREQGANSLLLRTLDR